MESDNKYLLIVGGTDSLGKEIAKVFKSNSSKWKIISIDYIDNTNADINITLNEKDKYSSKTVINNIYNSISSFSNDRLHCIINLSSIWKKSQLKQLDIFDDMDEMLNMNFTSSLLGNRFINIILVAHLGAKYLDANGLIILTGAAKVFKEIAPNMLPYQIAKTASHSLSLILKDSNEIPYNSKVITILPDIIDTPDNREKLPLEDSGRFLRPDNVAALIKMWADGYNCPKSGSFALLKNCDNYVIPEFI